MRSLVERAESEHFVEVSGVSIEEKDICGVRRGVLGEQGLEMRQRGARAGMNVEVTLWVGVGMMNAMMSAECVGAISLVECRFRGAGARYNSRNAGKKSWERVPRGGGRG